MDTPQLPPDTQDPPFRPGHPPAGTGTPDPTAAPTHVRWWMAALIFVISVITFVDRVNISIAARGIIPEYGLSQVQMGAIFSAFVVGYTLGFIPGGYLADRFGPRRTLGVSMVAWSVATVGTAWAGDVVYLTSILGVIGSFICVRLVFGLTEGPAIPSANRLVANWFPQTEKVLATSAMTAGVGFGAVAGPPFVAAIMSAFGWRAVFWITGGLGLIVAAVWFRYCDDFPAQHAHVNEAELRIIRGAETKPQTAKPGAGGLSRHVWRSLLTSRDVWLLIVAYALLAYVAYTFANWFYLYLVDDQQFQPQTAAWLVTLPFVMTIVVPSVGGRVSDLLVSRYGKYVGRIGVASGSLGLAALFLFAGTAAFSGVAGVAVLAIGHGLLFVSTAVMWATLAEMAPAYAGAAIGVLMTGGHVGAIIGPTLSPHLAQQYGWATVFQIMAGLALGAAIILGFVNPEKRLS